MKHKQYNVMNTKPKSQEIETWNFRHYNTPKSEILWIQRLKKKNKILNPQNQTSGAIHL